MTSDEHRPYQDAILRAYGVEATTTPSGRPVSAPHRVAPPSLGYATVHKVRRLGRVSEILIRLIFGTAALLAAALSASTVSKAVNVSFLERQHLTDRHHNARERRKTYCFSKSGEAHEAATYFTLYSYNFCWPVRTLRTRAPDGTWQKCTYWFSFKPSLESCPPGRDQLTMSGNQSRVRAVLATGGATNLP